MTNQKWVLFLQGVTQSIVEDRKFMWISKIMIKIQVNEVSIMKK